jgi:hypothetical protein
MIQRCVMTRIAEDPNYASALARAFHYGRSHQPMT